MKSPRFPVQLALPLDCFESARGGLPQSRERSKRRRSRLLQARLEANLAMLARLDIAPVSSSQNSDVNDLRQGQRFRLTPLLSSLINEVNGKRWPRNVSTLPPLKKGADAQSVQGRAPFRRRGLWDVPPYPVGRHERRSGLPTLRMRRRLHLYDSQALQVQSLQSPI